jgi:hypothetical protein
MVKGLVGEAVRAFCMLATAIDKEKSNNRYFQCLICNVNLTKMASGSLEII